LSRENDGSGRRGKHQAKQEVAHLLLLGSDSFSTIAI
jgi:hypothetical protein